MVVTKRLTAAIGALTLASTLAACSSAPREVDSDQPDQSGREHAGGSTGSTEESGEQSDDAPEDPFDGEQATISKITDFNAEDVCAETIGPSSDRVFDALGIEPKDGVGATYSTWEATYDKESWNIAPTLGCHAFINKDATDGSQRAIHVFVTEVGNQWHEGAEVSVHEDNDSVQAGVSFSVPEGNSPDDETITSYIKSDVLPKFKP